MIDGGEGRGGVELRCCHPACVVWCGEVWRGVVWCGVMFGVAWCDVWWDVWCGTECCAVVSCASNTRCID